MHIRTSIHSTPAAEPIHSGWTGCGAFRNDGEESGSAVSNSDRFDRAPKGVDGAIETWGRGSIRFGGSGGSGQPVRFPRSSAVASELAFGSVRGCNRHRG